MARSGIVFFLGYFFFLPSALWAAPTHDVVSRALDAYEAQIFPSEEGSLSLSSSGDILAERKPHETEMGIETYGYKYLEKVEGDHFMDLKGRFYGVFLNHTFRPHQMDPFFADFINMVRLELRYARGKMDYNGGVQFSNGDSVPLSMSGIPDWVLEGRVLIGKDIPWRGLMVTPFSGLGIRALEDDASKVSGTFEKNGVTNTISGYKRTSHYYYVPLGVELEVRLTRGWKARFSLEYDILIAGMQRSHSPVVISYQGVDYHYSSIKNRQTKGYGWRTALHLKKEMDGYGVFIEPFYRFWDIEDSQLGRFAATAGYEFVGVGMEPSNTTREIGVKMGVVF